MQEIPMSLLRLSTLLKNRRGDEGVRATATKIGISAATLSRVERGHVPDIETFRRICAWLEVDPNEFLDVNRSATKPASGASPYQRTPAVHLRADATPSPQVAADLASLILAAQAEMARRDL
jgi:transcriptional regulator with XRE-family HTH domain